MMKSSQNDHTTAASKRDIRKPHLTGLVFVAIVVLLILSVIVAGLASQQRGKKLAEETDQQLAELVGAVVNQTLTQSANLTLTQAILTGETPTHSLIDGSFSSGTLSPILMETAISTADVAELCSPIEGVPIEELKSIISQPFNVPNQHSDSGHHGVDLGSYNFHGQYLYEIPVRAILPGRVAGISVDRPPIGNVVILETKYDEMPVFLREFLKMEPGQSLYHFYGHLVNAPTFEIGTHLDCGEQIDLLGKSRTVEAHLHLETRIGKSGQVIEQMAFYDVATTEEERAEYLRWRTSGEFMTVDPMSIFQAYLDQPRP